MGYHYIALIDLNASGRGPQMSEAQAAFLRSRRLQSCIATGPITLFAAQGTPTTATPGGGMVVGHLFPKDGMDVAPDRLVAQQSVAGLVRHLLTRCWGEYLLIQPSSGPVAGLDILREPSGGVPCLYALQGGIGFITSDLSLATGLGLYHSQIDWDFIAQALAYPHAKTASTGLSGVRELLPGNSLVLRGTGLTIREDWSPWTFVDTPYRHSDRREAASELQASVARVVKTWAETDKAILVELSGGLDSSIVATCLRGTRAQVTCCTLVTPVPGADERQYARQVTAALEVELHDEELGFGNTHFDFILPTPTATPRMGVLHHVTHQVMETAACTHGTASFFSGGGGDTVFCYLGGAVPAADAFRERGLSAGFAAIRDLSTLHQCTHWKAGRLTLKKLLHGARAPYKANHSFLDPSFVTPAPDPHPWLAAPAGALSGDRERIADLAGTQVYRDGAPRGSTHWLRLPLLSQPVMEACLKVPTWMWIAGGENRAVARAAFGEQLPPGILERRSKGTFMHYFGAIYQRKKQQMRDYLLTGHLQAHRLLDTKALENFFEATLPPRDTSFMRAFDLCMIENWVRHQG